MTKERSKRTSLKQWKCRNQNLIKRPTAIAMMMLLMTDQRKWHFRYLNTLSMSKEEHTSCCCFFFIDLYQILTWWSRRRKRYFRDPMQKWLPLNKLFVHIQNSFTHPVQDYKFYTILPQKRVCSSRKYRGGWGSNFDWLTDWLYWITQLLKNSVVSIVVHKY